MKTDFQTPGFAAQQGAAQDSQARPQHQPAPDQAAAARFAALLGEDEVKQPEAAPAPDAKPRAEPTPGPMSQGDAILRGLLGGAAPANPAATIPPDGPAGRLLQEIAERVLVSEPRTGQEREVRITVKDEVFPGLEIRLSQDGGRLRVQLVALPGADVALLRSRIGDLALHLGKRLGRDVDVELLIEGEDSDAGDAAGSAAPLAPFRPFGPFRP